MLGSFSFVRSYQCFRIALCCQSPLEAVAQSTGLTTKARYSTFRCIFTHLFMQLGVWHRWKRAIGQISNTLRDSQPDRSLPQVTASPFQKAFFCFITTKRLLAWQVSTACSAILIERDIRHCRVVCA